MTRRIQDVVQLGEVGDSEAICDGIQEADTLWICTQQVVQNLACVETLVAKPHANDIEIAYVIRNHPLVLSHLQNSKQLLHLYGGWLVRDVPEHVIQNDGQQR